MKELTVEKKISLAYKRKVSRNEKKSEGDILLESYKEEFDGNTAEP